MTGINHLVKTLVEGKYPWVTVVKSSCHSYSLVASYACKQLSKSLEDLRRITPKQQDTYREEFQVLTQVELHRVLVLASTRWLSFQNCTTCVLEQWGTPRLY